MDAYERGESREQSMAPRDGGAAQQPELAGNGDEGQAPSDDETSQAERAAMHPDRHDLEWHYYFGAWSH